MSDDLLSPLKEIAVSAAIEFCLSQSLAEDLAKKIEDKLRHMSGGSQGYIAKVDRDHRNRCIREDFRGNNLNEVARKHGVSERQVRRIVATDKS